MWVHDDNGRVFTQSESLMTEELREALFAAEDAWHEAQMRYAEEQSKYIAVWFEGEWNVEPPEKVLVPDGLAVLNRLHADILAAQNNFESVAERIRVGRLRHGAHARGLRLV